MKAYFAREKSPRRSAGAAKRGATGRFDRRRIPKPSLRAAACSAQNIVHFARALREAGVPLGPGAVLDALAAVEAAGIGDRDDFYTTLACGLRQEA